jgi:LPXTG-motif cell wall-anchored protein
MSDRIRSISKWTAAAAFGATMFAASSASAHVDAVVASCEAGLVINLVDYDPAGVNTISVSIDGASATSASFGASFSTVLPFGDPFVTHSYRVSVVAWDDPTGAIGWTFDTGTRGIPVCAETTTTLVAVEPPATLPASTLPASTAPASTATTAPPTSAPASSAVVPSVLPGSTVVVAQASPTSVLVASEAPPVPGELPATGGTNNGLLAVALISGGLGALALGIVRRSARP